MGNNSSSTPTEIKWEKNGSHWKTNVEALTPALIQNILSDVSDELDYVGRKTFDETRFEIGSSEYKSFLKNAKCVIHTADITFTIISGEGKYRFDVVERNGIIDIDWDESVHRSPQGVIRSIFGFAGKLVLRALVVIGGLGLLSIGWR